MTIPLFAAEQEQTTSDDRYTPEWIFDELGISFTIDVAAPPGGVSWIPVDRFYTVEDDGLMQPWYGTVWCNPPFSNPLPWLERIAEHGDGVFLGPISANARWCALAFDTCDIFTHIIKIRFVHEDQQHRTIPTAIGLFGYGPVAVAAMTSSSKFTTMVRTEGLGSDT